MTSREFNQDTGRAKKAAADGPVIITDRGKPALVLLSFEEYERLSTRRKQSILDLVAMPEAADIEFDPPRPGDDLFRVPDLS
jgi:prevent-host-death family protein